MKLIERIRTLLLSPESAWAAIASNQDTPQQVFTGHVAPLSALAAICGFIGTSLVGAGFMGMRIRVPVVNGLVQMAVGFVLMLAMIGVLAWVIRWLAPRFGGTPDTSQAVKLAGYAATASLLGSVFQIIPALSMLGILAGLYSLYLLYLGLPVLMKNRPEETAKYAMFVVLAAIVCGLVIGLASALFTPKRAGAAFSIGGNSSISADTPFGRIAIGEAAIEGFGKRVEKATEKARAARASGDAAAEREAVQESAGAAMGMIAGMLGGGTDDSPNAGKLPATAEQLSAMVPERLAELPRNSIRRSSIPALGGGQVSARYASEDGRKIELDLMHNRMLGSVMRMAPEEESEDSRRIVVKRHDKPAGSYVEETYARDGSSASVQITLRNGVRLRLDGQGIDRAGIQAALATLPLERMGAL